MGFTFVLCRDTKKDRCILQHKVKKGFIAHTNKYLWPWQHRTTAKDSSRLLEDDVAGEISDHCDAGQSGGGLCCQVPQVLARDWDSDLWTLQCHHHWPTDTG